MPLRVSQVVLAAPIHNRSRRQEIISQGLTRKAKRFKKLVVDTMVFSPARGRVYRITSGGGFTRSHRASAKGDPPAPDTMNLVRSVQDNKISRTQHEVYVDGNRAPYGDYLERPRLNRPIMKERVLGEFESANREEDQRMLRELNGGNQ